MPEHPHPAGGQREPGGSRIFALFLKLGADPEDAYASVQEVQSMASENMIARFESKLDALQAELRSFRWFIASAIVLGAALVTLLQLIFLARAAG